SLGGVGAVRRPDGAARRPYQSSYRFRAGTWSFIADHLQIIAVFIFRQSVDNLFEIGLADEPHSQRDLFKARNLQPLPVLDRSDVIAGLEQCGWRAGIEPSHAAAEQFHP